jgi:DNA polymerase III epsilon subunit-like protein
VLAHALLNAPSIIPLKTRFEWAVDRSRARPPTISGETTCITEPLRADGYPDYVAALDRRLREGALLVHHAALDVGFLRRAYRRLGMRWPGPPVVDTVTLLLRAAKRARFLDPNAPEQEPDLNLLAARRKLGLPDYGQHDALVDAIAAAELFLVLRRQVGAKRLRDLT